MRDRCERRRSGRYIGTRSKNAVSLAKARVSRGARRAANATTANPIPGEPAGALTMQATHDLGGRAAGPIDRTERELEPWEKRVDAIQRLLSAPERRLISVDELRRAIEGLGAEEYDRLAYYERWIAAMTNLLLEKGVITIDELGRKLDAVRAREGGAP